MITRSDKPLIAVFLSVFLFCASIPSLALAVGTITEVRLSDDFNRLIIKSEGPIGNPEAIPCFKPSKLILDFKGPVPAAGLKSRKSRITGIPEVGVRATSGGTRIELNFGDAPLPRYRIRTLDDYVIVFLEQSRAVGVPKLHPGAHLSAAKSMNPRPSSPTKTRGKKKKARKPASKKKIRDGLVIKSSSVVDGNIVLHVAEGKRPEKVYRIRLGVDLSQPGFKAAEIQRSPSLGKKGPS